MPNIHHRYGGSTIKRTIECPGWAKLAATLPPGMREESEAATEGTALHDAMEAIMKSAIATEVEPAWFLKDDGYTGKQFNGVTLNTEHVERLYLAADAINDLMDTYDIDYENIMLEPFVEIIPELAGGSIDWLAVSNDGKTAVIADYKFGYYTVPAEINLQTLFYALCADADPSTTDMLKDVETLILAIIQPANDSEETPNGLDVWEAPISILDEFEGTVAQAVAVAESEHATFKSGDHCMFCPAMAICPIKTGEAQTAMKLPAVHIEQLTDVLPKLDDLEAWIKSVRGMAQYALENGTKIDGYKLVNKHPRRQWTDEVEVEKKLKSMRGVKGGEQYDQKLKSPAQLEKLFKQKKLDFSKINNYIAMVSSGTTMAPASDKREEAIPTKAFKSAMQRLD